MMRKLLKRFWSMAVVLVTLAGAASAETLALTVRCDAPESEVTQSGLRYGLFLEDINHALDGGLYAELIKNRSFEFGGAAQNGARHGWSAQEGVTFEVVDGGADGSAIHASNPHYARIPNSGAEPAGILGAGYLDGFAVEAGKDYECSVFLRADSDPGTITVSIRDTAGRVYAEAPVTGLDDACPVQGEWDRYHVTLRADQTVSRNLRICLQIQPGATVDVDMVSLMPADTFAGLPVRKDLGEALAAMHPAFLRFPGGCVIEGRSTESMYSWKASIGYGDQLLSAEVYPPLAAEDVREDACYSCDLVLTGDVALRSQGQDIWSGTSAHPYYTTYGLGFYEFFCLCEALDCEPLPVLNAGMTCPVQSPNYTVYAVNSDAFRQCVQDALELVEFCRGGTDTRWGAVRAAMGHPEPFDLTMIAIGNEQWQSEYYTHYLAFVEAFDRAAEENPELYGGIQLIVANGPSSGSDEGWDYVEGYCEDEDTRTAYVDEHFYMSPDWFFEHTDRYDRYDRSLRPRVFLGEYATQSNQLISALAEAAFMTGMERNGDMVALACYAPLFGNGTSNQWTPDMIFFNNTTAYMTPNYHVQSIFMNSALSRTLPASLSTGSAAGDVTLSGAAGLGSWMTSVAYDNLTVTDNATGEVLFAADFDQGGSPADYGLSEHTGEWEIDGGRLVQLSTDSPADGNTGDALYFGDTSWTDYTLSVDAEILSGAEGFLIPVCVGDPENTIFWNLGGWSNTVSCLQIVAGGAKSGQVDGTVTSRRLNQGQVYHLEVCVSGDTITCSLDGRTLITYVKRQTGGCYASAGTAENGDLIIRVVNATDQARELSLTLEGFDAAGYAGEAAVTTLAGERETLANSFLAPEAVTPTVASMATDEACRSQLPAWSLTVIRIPALGGE